MAEPPAGKEIPVSLTAANVTVEKALCSKDGLTSSLLGFPREFPFEFDSPTISSAFTSPGDSTETEDDSCDDEEDFLAGLTRRLALSTQRLPPPSFISHKTEEKRQVVSTSPQSTLSGLGSWSASGSGSPNRPSSQAPSPPTTPFRKDDAWDVISAAAGQVAKLKFGCGGGEPWFSRPNSNPNPLLRRQAPTPEPIALRHSNPHNAAFSSALGFQQLYSDLNQSSQVLSKECESNQLFYGDWVWNPKSSYYQSLLKFKSPEQQFPESVSSGFDRGNGRFVRPAAFRPPPPPPPHQASSTVRSVFPVLPAPKRSSAGTGVFLPRRYTNPSDSRKKSGGSNVVFPSKGYPQNVNFDEFDDLSPHSRPCLSSGHHQFDSAVPSRSGLSVRQGGGLRRVHGGCLNQERLLPQEWMY